MTQTLTTAHSPKKILLVADYGPNDLAFYEVVQKLQQLAGDSQIHVDIVSASAFNVPETAVLVAEGVSRGYDLVYHNTAPRLDGKPKDGNAGEGLGYVRVRNAAGKEVQVIGVASGNEELGNTFSLVLRDYENITPLRNVQFAETGSQFRSRDAFPQEVVRVLTTPDSQNRHLLEPITVDALPAPLETQARAATKGRIEQAEAGAFVRPGSSKNGYITIVGQAKDAQLLLEKVGALHPEAYIDFLPLKSTAPERQEHEASFVTAQLGINAIFPEGNRSFFVLPTDDAVQAFVKERPVHVAELTSHASVVSPLKSAFSFANHALLPEGQGSISSFATLPFAAIPSLADLRLVGLSAEALNRHIPPVDPDRIAYVDGYGNVKTSRSFEKYEKSADVIEVHLQGSDQVLTTGTTTGTSFDTKRGQSNLSRGSSGWGEGRLTEVWVRNGSAAAVLGHPEPGQEIHIHGFDRKPEAATDVVLGALSTLFDAAQTVLSGRK